MMVRPASSRRRRRRIVERSPPSRSFGKPWARTPCGFHPTCMTSSWRIRVTCPTCWRRNWSTTPWARPGRRRHCSAPLVFATPPASRPAPLRCGATSPCPIACISPRASVVSSESCARCRSWSARATRRGSPNSLSRPSNVATRGAAALDRPLPNSPLMPLPDLIEIVPLTKPVQAQITVPGSKSITNRALILAALASGETTLRGALWSEDTEVMTAALRDLGFQITVEADPAEACNRTIRVQGLGGKIPRAGTAAKPLELFVGNAGTAARFLAAMLCLGDGVYRLRGVPRMHERPQAALFAALRELGYRVDSANDKLPALIHGGGRRFAKCKVSIEESSQFASALLLGAQQGGWKVEVTGENAEESPYVAMTLELRENFPRGGGTFQIEPDASSGSYFWGANHLLAPGGKNISVNYWPASGWQIDAEFPGFLPLPKTVSR